ncbi:metallophosphoesterase family protein [Ectobacillus ponti]|uniref:Phosphoesterase n=1 Tax=Ectobacillus ponti TaxID=2961894 RepID=A0AA42BPW1_9BACI|nr:metallophosphoesterase [Ectobacillus ponti]MCP8969192.1 metallophosphoesterase [Ectobacillus ponti]
MRIIVMADTHMPKRAKKLPSMLLQDLRQADLIIHAGDWQSLALYEELSQYAAVAGVSGNVDGPEIRQHVPEKQLLHVSAFRIGIVHGHGKGKTTEKRAMAAFAGEKLDCLIFGHSHVPIMKYLGELLLFNPGSPTDRRKQPACSYGILTIGRELRAEHVFIE